MNLAEQDQAVAAGQAAEADRIADLIAGGDDARALAAAAVLVGAARREVAAVTQHPHGIVVHYHGSPAVLAASVPDAAGRVGLMLVESPAPATDPYGLGYTGTFPVFAPHSVDVGATGEISAEVGDDATADVSPLAGLTKAELLAYATEHKIEADPKAKRDDLQAVIEAALTALDATGGES